MNCRLPAGDNLKILQDVLIQSFSCQSKSRWGSESSAASHESHKLVTKSWTHGTLGRIAGLNYSTEYRSGQFAPGLWVLDGKTPVLYKTVIKQLC